jgi:hypothetical protein
VRRVVLLPVLVAALIAGTSTGGASAAAAPWPGADTSCGLLAPAGVPTGRPIDGIGVGGMEQPLYHIHVHLAVYVDGVRRVVPYGIGIVGPYTLAHTAVGPFVTSGRAYYWTHTHDETGIIHVESPVAKTFTLGGFFAVWGQPLTASQVGPAAGSVTAYVDGRRYTGDPAAITLTEREIVQLDVGTDVAPQPYTFPGTY